MSLFRRNHPHPDEIENTDDENDESIDPELRLRTVRTAASAIAESIRSERRAQKRRKPRRKGSSFFRRGGDKRKPRLTESVDSVATTKVTGNRRNIYVNLPLQANELDHNGEPTIRYARNKIRTSKYNLITFLPKNLFLQFQRVANIYFLALVILQLFPVFGAAAASTAALPIAFILTVTAIRDGIEDYRRATLDEEVNTSACTKLGNWRNVNQPSDPRTWYEKLLGLNGPERVTKGVRKLREKDVDEGMKGILRRDKQQGDNDTFSSFTGMTSMDESVLSLGGGGERRLEDIQSIGSHSYPPTVLADAARSSASLGPSKRNNSEEKENWKESTMSTYQPSTHSKVSVGVVDWKKRVHGSAKWERTLWKKLEVGDIILLRDNEQVPADILVLSTSDPDGLCYLETKNLDGETNLKPRRACRATSTIMSEDEMERSSFILDSEPPHQNLYAYQGVLRYKDAATGEDKREPVSISELLLRGCAIRNTSWIIGLVVFTGADTKIMLNGGETPSKRSKIETETNFNVIVNFLVLILMCTIAAIFSGVNEDLKGTSSDFFEINSEPTNSSILNSIVTFVSCLIAFQNIVPISLYISIEIVKTIQAYFIAQDIDMYYRTFDTPCVPKSWNISDDLGQIEYIFSDKTGTLTQNIMEFQRCSVNGVSYGEGITEAQRGAATRQGNAGAMDPDVLNEKLARLKHDMISTLERSFKNRYSQPDKLTLVSPKIAQDLVDRSSEQRTHLMAFFRALAICHSVLSDRPERDQPYQLEYKAESPDEAALVAAARDVGFPFVNKSKDDIEIEVLGQAERWTLLRVLEFNSARKRMSVVVRSPEGRLILYCKGADSVIYERLVADHDKELKSSTQRDMEMFANSGLRTLCIAYRYLTEDEFLQWSRVYDAAAASIDDREEELERASEQIEHSLLILGATALEDKLQEGVPEAIETLHQAGIKLWILTGDKLQTAIEIGYSCNLLKSDMDVMILSADSVEAARSKIEAGLNKIASVLGPPSLDPRKRGFIPGAQTSFAVVIDGDTLRHALSPELKPLFLNLGTQCETVVCCRVSPAQKALTVKLVKEGRNAMTLSIGDGANDVAMIQEANIGCGLFGLEGSQAAMSADYAFGQFRFLVKLLLVHGRWSYQRIADMHANFFYKNVIWTFAMFWYLPFNSFDATYLYQYTFILLYNVVFTSLPVISLGAFDQDINAKAALAFPQLYIRGICGLEYTRTKFWLYMLDGLYQSGVVFFIPFLTWTLGLAVAWNGRGIDSLADFGTTVSVAAIVAANTYIGINTKYWTVITWVVVVGSSAVMILWIVVYSFFPSADFVDEVVVLFGELTFWTAVVFSVIVALMPRFLIKYFSSVYLPLDKDLVREMWVMGDLKQSLGVERRRKKRSKGASSLHSGDVETFPMFHEQDVRSASEMSLPAQQYEMTPRNTVDADTETSVPEDTPDDAREAQDDGRDLERRRTPSPQLSYYSLSELRPPSPMPESVYRYPSGEYTRTAPTSYRPSISSRTVVSYAEPSSPTLEAAQTSQSFASVGHRLSYDASRHQARLEVESFPTQGTDTSSFATAEEGMFDDEHRRSESRDSWQEV